MLPRNPTPGVQGHCRIFKPAFLYHLNRCELRFSFSQLNSCWWNSGLPTSCLNWLVVQLQVLMVWLP